MSGKKKEPELEYTYEKLQKAYKTLLPLARAGKAGPAESFYGMAAGYATDLADVSREIFKPLDFTGRTEANVFPCLVRACASNYAQKKSTEDNKEDLIKKLGYYQLFSIYNSLNCEKKTIEIVLTKGVVVMPKLVLRTLPDSNGKTYDFDPLDAARETISKMIMSDPEKNGGAVLFGEMTPFYKRMETDLLCHLS